MPTGLDYSSAREAKANALPSSASGATVSTAIPNSTPPASPPSDHYASSSKPLPAADLTHSPSPPLSSESDPKAEKEFPLELEAEPIAAPQTETEDSQPPISEHDQDHGHDLKTEDAVADFSRQESPSLAKAQDAPPPVADMEVRMATKTDVDVTEVWREFKERPTTPFRNRLVERYLPLVKYNAERIWQRLPEGVDLDDLISAGVFGLMDAIDAFDLSRGVKFETYCVPRIRGAMLDELRTMDWVPRLVRSKHSKMEEARKSLEALHGRPPTDAEIAERLGVSSEEFEKMSMDSNAVGLISLNKKWYETDSYKDVREIDILEDKKGEDPTSRLQRKDLMRMVTKGLNRNERLIIILYYYEELTMKEIGVTLDLSESRVSQMHSAIIQRLQQQLSTRRPEFGG